MGGSADLLSACMVCIRPAACPDGFTGSVDKNVGATFGPEHPVFSAGHFAGDPQLGTGGDEMAVADAGADHYPATGCLSRRNGRGRLLAQYAQSDWGIGRKDVAGPGRVANSFGPLDAGGRFRPAVGHLVGRYGFLVAGWVGYHLRKNSVFIDAIVPTASLGSTFIFDSFPFSILQTKEGLGHDAVIKAFIQMAAVCRRPKSR